MTNGTTIRTMRGAERTRPIAKEKGSEAPPSSPAPSAPPARSFPRLPVGRARIPAAAPEPAPEPAGTPKEARAEPEEFLRVGRVARILDVSTKRVYQLVRGGDLQGMRIGPRQVRVSARSLDRYVRERIREEAEREDHAR